MSIHKKKILAKNHLNLYPSLENSTTHITLIEDHWINQPLKSEDEKTLLLSAIDLNQYDFLDVLLRSGADPNLYRLFIFRRYLFLKQFCNKNST